MRHTKAIIVTCPTLVEGEPFDDEKVFRFDTDERRVRLVDAMISDEQFDFLTFFQAPPRLHAALDEDGHPTNVVQFATRNNNDESEPTLLTFSTRTREDKLKIADWIEATRCEPFLRDEVTMRIDDVVTVTPMPDEAIPLVCCLHAVTKELAALRHTMPDETYVRLSNALTWPLA